MQTEKNIWIRMLSMILTLALLISCVPNQVYAMDGVAPTDLLEATDTAVLQPDATPEPTLGTARIVAEDASRRGEFYKEYIMNNGLRYATVYPSAIHYEEGGQWKDIDNTLVAAISGGKSVYQNKAGAWNVRFPQSLSSSDMIGITKDGFTVQFGMAGEMRSSGDLVVASIGQIGTTADTLAVSSAQTATAQIQQIDLTATRAAAEHPETILDKLNSRLTYANVYPNTNVVYDLQGTQLKESVVMQQYDASLWGYRYTLDTGDLVPVLREDQQIDLCHPDTNEVVLTMPAPYMFDNNGEICYDVDVALKRNGNNYLLSYYLPREWLADANRAWPVILDPVVTGNSRYTNVKDVTVAETGTESSTRGVIQCGYMVGSGAMRIYMQYINLPIIPSGNVIVDATISLIKPMNYSTASNVEVHKVTETWTSSTITWANKAAYEEEIVDYVVCQNAGTYTWNITSIVQDWYETGNYGMMFKTPSEVEEAGVNNWKQFYSSDYSNSADTLPELTITYQPVVYDVTLSQDSATMYTGDTLALTATTTPAGQTVTWHSDAPTVASVSDTGLVTALSAGTATITAALTDGTTASCEIEVVAKSITLNYNTSNNRAVIYKGQTVVITATTDPEGQAVTWDSDAPNVATIDDTGLVTALSPGTAKITATLEDGTTAECEVEVLATDVHFECACESDCAEDCTCGCRYMFISIYSGETVTLTAKTIPDGQPVTWESMNPTVATVVDGVVTGVSPGNAVIRASLSADTYVECQVEVLSSTIDIGYENVTVVKDPSKDALVLLTLETVSQGLPVTWSTSDSTIATVNTAGLVTIHKIGGVTITATLPDGTSDSCVIRARYRGELSHYAREEYDGTSFDLVFSPQIVENVTWTSSDTSIATVDSSGRVTCLKPGDVTITANSPDLLEPVSCSVTIRFGARLYQGCNQSNGWLLTSQEICILNDILVIQDEDAYFSGELDYLAQLWRITYVGGEYYTIRPAFKLNLGLSVDAFHDVRLVDIGIQEREELVPANALWKITRCENGYRLECKAYPGLYLMPYTSSENPRTKIVCDDDVTSSACVWNFSAESIFPHAIAYSKTTGKPCKDPEVNVAKTKDLLFAKVCEDIVFSIASNTGFYQDLSWDTDTPDLIEVDEDGNLHGIGYGTANIIVTPDVPGSAISSSYGVYVTKFKLTGYELEYDLDSWNYYPVQDYTNCYSYALNCQVHPRTNTTYKLLPGYANNSIMDQDWLNVPKIEGETRKVLIDYIMEDAVHEEYGFYFERYSENAVIPEGAYLVALFVDLEHSFHWYRQNPDGTWSHKNSDGPVKNRDESGDIIYDPCKANKDFTSSDGWNYDTYIGYFYVTPLNRFYK